VVVAFLGVVAAVLVCARNDIELITNIAAIVARSCFVMEPRKILKRQKDRQENQPGFVAYANFSPLLFPCIVPKSCEWRNNLCGFHREIICLDLTLHEVGAISLFATVILRALGTVSLDLRL
jgi:hypothetical protein